MKKIFMFMCVLALAACGGGDGGSGNGSMYVGRQKQITFDKTGDDTTNNKDSNSSDNNSSISDNTSNNATDNSGDNQQSSNSNNDSQSGDSLPGNNDGNENPANLRFAMDYSDVFDGVEFMTSDNNTVMKFDIQDGKVVSITDNDNTDKKMIFVGNNSSTAPYKLSANKYEYYLAMDNNELNGLSAALNALIGTFSLTAKCGTCDTVPVSIVDDIFTDKKLTEAQVKTKLADKIIEQIEASYDGLTDGNKSGIKELFTDEITDYQIASKTFSTDTTRKVTSVGRQDLGLSYTDFGTYKTHMHWTDEDGLVFDKDRHDVYVGSRRPPISAPGTNMVFNGNAVLVVNRYTYNDKRFLDQSTVIKADSANLALYDGVETLTMNFNSNEFLVSDVVVKKSVNNTTNDATDPNRSLHFSNKQYLPDNVQNMLTSAQQNYTFTTAYYGKGVAQEATGYLQANGVHTATNQLYEFNAAFGGASAN